MSSLLATPLFFPDFQSLLQLLPFFIPQHFVSVCSEYTAQDFSFLHVIEQLCCRLLLFLPIYADFPLHFKVFAFI